MTRTTPLKGITLQELVEALSLKMDNELKIFLQSFQALSITDTQVQQLKGILSDIQQNAKNLALYDSITHAWLRTMSRMGIR